jgi:hypothetical protein
MNIKLTDDEIKLVIAALHYYSHIEAGQTQAPNLRLPRDYVEYHLACDLQVRLNTSTKLRNLWERDPRTGETVRKTS